MKKHLLGFAALLFAGSMFAQEDVDITPAKYKFANQPVGKFEVAKFFTGANIPAPCTATVEEFYDEGLFVIAGGQFANPAQPHATDVQAGISIVDLGGEAGKVFCISGMNSNYNSLNSMDYAQCTGGLNWFNLNWFTDPQNTPKGGTAEAPNIRVRLVLNVYANTLDESANIINSAYMVTNQGNVMPAGSNSVEGVAITSGSFAELDEDGEPVTDDEENYVYDPTKWMVYEWDTYCPNEEGAEPLRLKMEMNQGNLANATVFIKEISFTQLADTSEPIISTRKKTYETYEVDPQKVESAIAAIKAEGAAEYYNLAGMKVDAAGLTQGVYIVKKGATTSKVIVK